MTIIQQKQDDLITLKDAIIQLGVYQNNLNNNTNLQKFLVETQNFTQVCKYYLFYYN